jgi:3-methyladenine DNA glycosylase AlkD
MTAKEILKELEQLGDERTKSTLERHGAREPFFGVKIADLKKVLKKTRKNHELALELYDTGNSDAMYLAGLMADENKITREQLEEWVNKAYWSYLSEFAVPWVAAETKFGFELGQKWMGSHVETTAAAGWATLASYAGVHNDEELDIQAYSHLLHKVEKDIHSAQNRVKYAMNGFIISVGTYIKELTDESMETAKRIGKVEVMMGGTACKVPLAAVHIKKAIESGMIGKKRKTARC